MTRVDGREGAIVTALLALGLLAEPAPSRAQDGAPEAYAITGATVHTVSGGTIENATVVLRDGRILAVGPDAPVPPGAEVIDATGKHVYPGMIDAFSRLGLTEIGAVSATNDAEELGDFNIHLSAYAAIHPASEHIPVARANGITHTLAAPGGGGGFGGGGDGGIPGQATLIHLDGWTVEEMAIEPSAAMVIEWPTIRTRSFNFQTFSQEERSFTEAKEEYDEAVGRLEEWMIAAKHYAQAMDAGSERVERDLQLEHLARVLNGGLPVIVIANDRRGIESAIEFSDRHGLRMILAGGREAREMKETLAEKGIPVILGPTQTVPEDRDDPYDDPNTLPGELHAAGVEIAFATFNSSDSRTLPYEVANAVPFGLSKDAAIEAITLGAARILGVDDRLGSVEVGKVGNLIVTDGDPLEIQTRIEHVFIKGVPVDLSNKHRELWEKYRNRPQKGKPVTVSSGATP
ncbi:MAG: amidohydrolase family protein [Gemmatimonadota bacterium]